MKTERELFEEWYGVKPKGWFEAVRYNTAWRAWQASANREGYKLVPVNPTPEMIKKGKDAYSISRFMTISYKAMINAAD